VLAGWRLLRCNPWSDGGVDYVRDQQLFPLFRSRRTKT
jgi:putative component of membrane protein insertase Oxa1/YidC/SpoIIIJ protein YidD